MNIKGAILKLFKIVFILPIIVFLSCKESKTKSIALNTKVDIPMFFKISLAQWSLHKNIQSKIINPFDFAKETKRMGFDAVEYVSALYASEIKDIGMNEVINKLKLEGEIYGVKNLLIMVDGEGGWRLVMKKNKTRL